MKAQETKKAKELIKFLKRPLNGTIAKILTWEQSKILLDYIEDLESKNKEKIILNKLEEWLKKRIAEIEEEKKDWENDIPLSNWEEQKECMQEITIRKNEILELGDTFEKIQELREEYK